MALIFVWVGATGLVSSSKLDLLVLHAIGMQCNHQLTEINREPFILKTSSLELGYIRP